MGRIGGSEIIILILPIIIVFLIGYFIGKGAGYRKDIQDCLKK